MVIKSKLIHLKCGFDILTSGSRNQPIRECTKCGLINNEDITTKYQCNSCLLFYNDEDGIFDIALNKFGSFDTPTFTCKSCLNKDKIMKEIPII